MLHTHSLLCSMLCHIPFQSHLFQVHPANFHYRPIPLGGGCAQKASLYVDLSHSMPIPSPKSLPSSLDGTYSSRTPQEIASFAFSTFSISSKNLCSGPTILAVHSLSNTSKHCLPAKLASTFSLAFLYAPVLSKQTWHHYNLLLVSLHMCKICKMQEYFPRLKLEDL